MLTTYSYKKNPLFLHSREIRPRGQPQFGEETDPEAVLSGKAPRAAGAFLRECVDPEGGHALSP